MNAAELRALKDRIERLELPERVKLAAGLLAGGADKVALPILERVVLELGARVRAGTGR